MGKRWILAGCLLVLAPLMIAVNAWTLLYMSERACGATGPDPEPGSFLAAYCDLQTTSSNVRMVFLVMLLYGPSLLTLAGGGAGIAKAAPRLFATAVAVAVLWLLVLVLPALLLAPSSYHPASGTS